jgi:hypothetical protein
MTFKELLAKNALESVKTGFTPSVSPACANYVSAMCRKSGEHISINYVPNFFGISNIKVINKKITPQAGYIVIFDYTYDAVSPSGIGAEDTMTHVGIITDNKGGLVHFSNSQGRPVQSNVSNWYINSYIDLKPNEKEENEQKNHWAYDSYLNLKNKGIVNTEDFELDLNGTPSRGEVYKIVSRAIEYCLKNNK